MRDEDEVLEEEKQESEEYKRERRRKKRLKAQITAYIGLLIILAVAVGLVAMGVKKASEAIFAKQAEQAAALTSSNENAAEDVTILSPNDETALSSEPTSDALEEKITEVLSAMTVEEKVAGLFVITPEQLTGVDSAVKAGSGTQTALQQYAVGGLVYFTNNIKDEAQVADMLAQTSQMSKYPIFLAVNEEGGDGSVVAANLGLGGTSAPSLFEDKEDAADNGTSIGNYLISYGFNVNLAPCVNLNDSASAFGTDANTTSEKAAAYVEAMEASGISACMKNFPVESLNQGNGLEQSELSKEDLQSNAFIPFEAGIYKNVNFIMMSNISCPAITGDSQTPCSLSSKAITDTLRGELGYGGIVITDALNTPAITGLYSADNAAVAAIQAGADVIYLPEDFNTAYTGVLNAVNGGTITQDRLDESLRRIFRIKYAELMK